MDDNTIKNNDAENEDFKKLLEGSFIKNDNFSVGDKVNGPVVFISKENVFVDISGKSEAIVDIKEFINDSDGLTISKGDYIDAYIVSLSGGEILLSTNIGRGHTNLDMLDKAYQLNIPVEGAIVNIVKGGYNVSISGIACFCPHSQIDLKAPSNPDALLSKKFSFQIIEFGENGRNIILSRRVLLEEKRQIQLKELQDSINEGDIVSCEIASIQEFGLFADIGGIEALIPKSEISWSRRPNTGTFNIGDKISAKVVTTDWENEKIVLSIKRLIPEPWDRIEQYNTGQSVNGRVINIIKSGAFVEIEPGLEGYIPLSRMSLIKRINKPEEVLSIDDTVNVKIININTEDKKILLQLITDEPDPWLAPTDDLMEKINTATIESTRPAGISVRLPNGMTGFVPAGELAIQRGKDIQKAYPAGKEMKVVVKDIIKEERRLILSERNALKQKEMDEYKEYMHDGTEGKNEDSTFGNIFKDKFDEIKKKMNSD